VFRFNGKGFNYNKFVRGSHRLPSNKKIHQFLFPRNSPTKEAFGEQKRFTLRLHYLEFMSPDQDALHRPDGEKLEFDSKMFHS
jgi:hypothetical protein